MNPCAEPARDLGEDGSGARNPLDRLVSLIKSMGDNEPIEWLCAQAGGCFAEIDAVEHEAFDSIYIHNTQTILAHFSDLLHVLSESIANENRVDPEEAAAIRKQWQKLVGRGEAFVRACEEGRFDPER